MIPSLRFIRSTERYTDIISSRLIAEQYNQALIVFPLPVQLLKVLYY